MISILIVRYQQVKNQVINQLKNFPLLSSLVFLVPFLFYLVIDLTIPTEWMRMKLNPNIIELIYSFDVIFIQVERYVLVIVAIGFVFFINYNQQVFWKYKSYPINFINITKANILTLLFCVNLLLLIFAFMFGIVTNSTIISSLILFLLLLIGINSTVIIAFFFYICGTYFLRLTLNKLSLIMCSLCSVVFFTIPVLLLLNHMSLTIVLGSNSVLTIFILILSSVILFCIFNKISFKNELFYNPLHTKKSGHIFFENDDIGILKNYLLLLIDNFSVYIEYLVAFLLFIILMVTTKIFDTNDLTIQSLVVVSLLTSSGLIFHYDHWFFLRSKKVLNKTLLLDALFYIVSSIVFSILLQIIMLKEWSFTTFLVLFVSNIICQLSQRIFKLKFSKRDNTMMSFTLFYGLYSFFIILVIKSVI